MGTLSWLGNDVADEPTQDDDKLPADQGVGNGKPPKEHQWKPGQSGNPAGRKSAGASIKEWINVLSEKTAEEVRDVLTDPLAPTAKVMAARMVLSATVEDVRDATVKVIEYTDGKPQQAVDITTGGKPLKGYTVVSPDDWDGEKKDGSPEDHRPV